VPPCQFAKRYVPHAIYERRRESIQRAKTSDAPAATQPLGSVKSRSWEVAILRPARSSAATACLPPFCLFRPQPVVVCAGEEKRIAPACRASSPPVYVAVAQVASRRLPHEPGAAIEASVFHGLSAARHPVDGRGRVRGRCEVCSRLAFSQGALRASVRVGGYASIFRLVTVGEERIDRCACFSVCQVFWGVL